MHTALLPDAAPLGGLVLRPDMLTVAVAASVEGLGGSRALPILRDAAAVVVRALAQVDRHATLVARRLHLGGGHSDKSAKGDRSDVQLDGVVQVPLADTFDFWARAELAVRTVDALIAAAHQLSRQKPAVQLGWREPVARVADEDAHRAALLDRHGAQLRAPPAGDGGAVAVADIVQIPVSLDEVRLTLGWGRLR